MTENNSLLNDLQLKHFKTQQLQFSPIFIGFAAFALNSKNLVNSILLKDKKKREKCRNCKS